MRKKKTSRIEKKLDAILRKEDIIEREELNEEAEEKRIEKLELEQLSEMKTLEQLEREIKEQVKDHPLKKIGIRDFARGIVGAFVGVIIHNSVYYGSHLGEEIDLMRAIIMFLLSFILGGLLLYGTGFKKIKDLKLLWFLPIRLGVLYSAAIIVSFGALFIFLPSFGQDIELSFKLLAAVQLPAVIGATTADLIGRE